jgi:selenocysteine lyase/cysteine desulfurase
LPTCSVHVGSLPPAKVAEVFAQRNILAGTGPFDACESARVRGVRDPGGVVPSGFADYNTVAEVGTILSLLGERVSTG